ncbi:hypothetical protein MTO96_009839 [Rhipicephalus appendiculatus]
MESSSNRRRDPSEASRARDPVVPTLHLREAAGGDAAFGTGSVAAYLGTVATISGEAWGERRAWLSVPGDNEGTGGAYDHRGGDRSSVAYGSGRLSASTVGPVALLRREREPSFFSDAAPLRDCFGEIRLHLIEIL